LKRLNVILAAVAFLCVAASARAQGNFPPEDFNAIAMLNDATASGAGRVEIRVTRWSSNAERDRLVKALLDKGADDLLENLKKTKAVGIIKTPDSLGYDLHYAFQTKGEDGGRDIVIATDRPIGFWEVRNQPRTIDYPFTVIQMHIDKDGHGTGTMSVATKITAIKNTIELENFSTAPVMLTEIEAKPHRNSN